jgi:hypothetical protein
MEKPRKRGRPQKPLEEAKGAILHLRIGHLEQINYERAAERVGVPLSEWVRDRLNHAAMREANKAIKTAKA